MGPKRKTIPPQVKRQAVELLASGMRQRDVAITMGVDAQAVHRWKKAAMLSGEWANIRREAAAASEADALAAAALKRADKPTPAVIEHNASPFAGYGGMFRPPEPPPSRIPKSEATVARPCLLCGALKQPHELGAGHRIWVCQQCLNALRTLTMAQRAEGGK